MRQVQTDPEAASEERALLMCGLGLILAGANVIMQLARLPIGYGVAASTVESGSLFKHPVKRTRTTLGYVMIALFGTDYERAVLRSEVGRQHRNVRSRADSTVRYNAFDPELQLWVAACMYRGLEDSAGLFYGVQDSSTLDRLYDLCSRFATTLQVPASMWPVDRVAFVRYWEDGVAKVHMDGMTRRYLHALASLDFLPPPFGWLLGPVHRFVTTGALSERFRSELGLAWSPRDEQRFRQIVRGLAVLNRRIPRPLREFPWNLVLWDTRRRIHRGIPLV